MAWRVAIGANTATGANVEYVAILSQAATLAKLHAKIPLADALKVL